MREFMEENDQPYEMVVVEQADMKPFNRGFLINIAFQHSLPNITHFALHDIDELPLPGVDYSFPRTFTHLSSELSRFRFQFIYIYEFSTGYII
jgi:hypothetical protein